MEEEIWKDIEGYEGLYQVSNFGRVRSLDRIDCRGCFRTGKILSPSALPKGYLQVVLCKNGKHKTCKVHRLVIEAFLPNPDNLPQVNHKDENVKNNNVKNLEWCDNKYNCNYGSRTERAAIGHINGKKSKPVLQFTKNGVFVREWPSQMEIQRSLGFAQANIYKCCRGKRKTAYGFIWEYAA